jgi:hypothetical protein
MFRGECDSDCDARHHIAVDRQQKKTTTFGDQLQKFSTQEFKTAAKDSFKCLSEGSDCYTINRGDSRWWVIKPTKPTGVTAPMTILLTLRDFVLDDNLDKVTVYTRTGGVASKQMTLTGLRPYKLTQNKTTCELCSTPCRRHIADSGTIEYPPTPGSVKQTCMWIIETSQTAVFVNSIIAQGLNDTFVIESCFDYDCQSTALFNPMQPASWSGPSLAPIIRVTYTHGTYPALPSTVNYGSFSIQWNAIAGSLNNEGPPNNGGSMY